LDSLTDAIKFLEYPTKDNEIWILKPHNLNQGRGIQLINDINQFKRNFHQGKQYQISDYYQIYVEQERQKLKQEIQDRLGCLPQVEE
jgi:hypothetical protein